MQDPRSITRPDPALRTYYVIISLPGLFMFPFIYLPLYFKYRTLRYRFDDDGVSMSWGRFFQRETYLTYRRIQDIRVTRGVIQRWLGLSELGLQTASGGGGAEMKIEGIRDADALRDFLYERMRGAQDDNEGDGVGVATRSGGIGTGAGGVGTGADVGGVGAGATTSTSPPPAPPVPDEALQLLLEIRDELRRVNSSRGAG